MGPPPYVHRFWGAMDALFATVAPTPWGAVVTDGRFPRVWDANYARVDAAGVRLDDVAEALLPALRASGADLFHVVAFDPEGSTALLTDLSRRGHRLAWDVVMDVAAADAAPAGHPVEALAAGEELWDAVEASLRLFGDPADALAQLRAIETEVMGPGGKRWFGSARTVGSCRSPPCSCSRAWATSTTSPPSPRTAAGGTRAPSPRTPSRRHATTSSAVVLLADPEEPAVVRDVRADRVPRGRPARVDARPDPPRRRTCSRAPGPSRGAIGSCGSGSILRRIRFTWTSSVFVSPT